MAAQEINSVRTFRISFSTWTKQLVAGAQLECGSASPQFVKGSHCLGMAMRVGTGFSVISGSRHQRSGSRSTGTHASKASFQFCYTSSRQRLICRLCRSLQARTAAFRHHTHVSRADGHCNLEEGDSPASKKLSAPLPSKACLQKQEQHWHAVWQGAKVGLEGSELHADRHCSVHMACRAHALQGSR